MWVYKMVVFLFTFFFLLVLYRPPSSLSISFFSIPFFLSRRCLVWVIGVPLMKKPQLRGSRGRVIMRCEGGTTGGPRRSRHYLRVLWSSLLLRRASVPQEPYQLKVTSTYKLKKGIQVPIHDLVELDASLWLFRCLFQKTLKAGVR